MRRAARALTAAALLAPLAARAQTLASGIDAVRDGTVRFAFAARPDVCSDGRGSLWVNDRGSSVRSGPGYVCMHGPVRVTLGRDAGQTVSVRTCVACDNASRGNAEHDLGLVSAAEAARYLVRAAHGLAGKNANDAVSAAAFADSVDVTAAFADLVRDDDATIAARKQALFWFGQSDAPTKSLVALYDARSPLALREQFTFVVSQRRDDAAVEKLVAVARGDADLSVRKKALFWLGQTENPKALAFFRALLVP